MDRVISMICAVRPTLMKSTTSVWMIIWRGENLVKGPVGAIIQAIYCKARPKSNLSTRSLVFPSNQGDSTIIHKGNFLKLKVVVLPRPPLS